MPPERVERKLAAIVCADVVGYSRLMEADEEGTLARLKASRRVVIEPAVARYGGRIVKLTGDGMLLEFASVVDALRSVIAIQQGVAERETGGEAERQLRWRIGIHLGDVIADGADLYGDGVNVASRLEGIADPGGIAISHAAYEQVRDRLEGASYESLGEQQVKNIARPVSAYRVLFADVALPVALSRPAGRSWRWPALACAVLILLIAAGAALWWQLHPAGDRASSPHLTAIRPPDRPSIAVLPFVNMSDDPEQAYFADGMAEDLITDLSKLAGLLVIARNSSFAYKGGAARDVRKIGRELGVRYVLEGSARRVGDHLRINAQLIDAQSGQPLWAERYDGALSAMFEVQDSIREKILRELAVRLTPEQAAAFTYRGTHSVEAYDHFLRGMTLLSQQRLLEAELNLLASKAFEAAIAIDPGFAQAYAGLAWSYYLRFAYINWNNREPLDKAVALAAKSLGLRDNALAHRVLAKQHFRPTAWGSIAGSGAGTGTGYEEALAELEKARALEPNNPDVLADLAHTLAFMGELDRAAGYMNDAVRLNPNPPVWYRATAGIINLLRGNYRAAIDDLRIWRDHESLATSSDAVFFLSAALALDGQIEAAQANLAPWMARYRNYTTAAMKYIWRFKRDSDWQLVESGLLKAGMLAPPQ